MFICNVAREFKKLRRQVQGKRHIKIELCAKLSLLRLFHVDHVVQNRRSALSLAWHEWFHNERFTTASSRCRHNLKYENFTSSFARLRQNIAAKSVLHVQHDYPSSFNQSNHWFVGSSLTLPSSNLKFPNVCLLRHQKGTNWVIYFEYCRRYIKFILILAKGVASSPIHVAPGFYIVKSVDDEILTLKKLISVQRFLSFWTNCKRAK